MRIHEEANRRFSFFAYVGEKIRQLLVETWKVSSVMNNNFKSIF